MFTINKVISHHTVDFAAEELKKYLRMMMPEAGDVIITYDPLANDGFRLGLMENFGIPLLEGEDRELDDVIYGVMGFLAFFAVFSVIRGIIHMIFRTFRKDDDEY